MLQPMERNRFNITISDGEMEGGRTGEGERVSKGVCLVISHYRCGLGCHP